MNIKMKYNNPTSALIGLAGQVMSTGTEQGSRGGQQTREQTFVNLVIERPWRRYIALPERAVLLPAQIAETMWVLAGRADVEWLSHYLPRAAEFSDDGKTWRAGYGPRLRNWGGWPHQAGEGQVGTDQLEHVVQLLDDDPDTRRAVISLYDPAVDSQDGKDIACNNWLHFLIRDGRLHLNVATRSNDLIWGWSGINLFEWSALQEIVAGLVGVQVGELHFNISSLHVYDRHWDKANRIAKATTPSSEFDGPRFQAPVGVAIDTLIGMWFELESAIREGKIDDGIADHIYSFPEPMMQSWLRVIAWWWTKDIEWIRNYEGTDLYATALLSPRPKPKPALDIEAFVDFVTQLHTAKHQAYGDSWKRRGEQIGIMANIARKIDRLGVSGAGDSSADTAIDLLVYLCKYSIWLAERRPGMPHSWLPSLMRWPVASDSDEPVNVIIELLGLQGMSSRVSIADRERELTMDFAELEKSINDYGPGAGSIARAKIVDEMIPDAFDLALRLWSAEQVEGDDYLGADHD